MMRRNFRFGLVLAGALCLAMAAAAQARSDAALQQVAQLKTSPPPSDARPSSGATKPDDQTTPQTEQAPSNGGSTAAPSPPHEGRSAKQGKGEHPDRGLTDKGKAAPAKAPETPEIHMKDLGKVDTRITVVPEPHRPGDKKQTPPLHSPTGLRVVPPPLRQPGGPANRNSIGETVPSSARPAAPAPSAGGSRSAPNPTIAARSSEAPGNTVPSGNPSLAPLPTPPITAAPAAPRSAINGSSITRSSNLPGGLGGQTKPVGGINGSEIRPKH
jgi:hypothetical protein